MMRYFFILSVMVSVYGNLNGERGYSVRGCKDCNDRSDLSYVPMTPLMTPLTPFYADIFCGNYVASGTSVRNTWSGSITITGIPGGSTIRKAFLYWMILHPTNPGGSGNFNGNPITGQLIGVDGDPCWGVDSSYAFRLDVTSYVSGNGTYNVSFSGGTYGEGASLVVLYENNTEQEQIFLIYDGNTLLKHSPNVYQWTMQGFNASTTPQAKITYIIADGQSTGQGSLPDSMYYNGSLLDWNTTEGFDGPYWDTRTYDVSALTPGGSTQSDCKYAMGDNNNAWDCVNLEVCILVVSKGPCPAGVEEDYNITRLQDYRLQIYPNPMVSGAYIEYSLPKATSLVLNVYDVTGRVIRTLVGSGGEGVLAKAGRHRIYWDGKTDTGEEVPSGIYFYSIKSESANESAKGFAICR